MLARMANQVFDPLASLRAEGDPDIDVLVWGTVFLDIIFTGLERLPEGGEEVWADGMGSCPGGIANLAVAARRLGLRTSLAAAFGDDAYGDFCWETLEAFEHIDLSRSRRFEGWHSPVTISMAVHRDRGMVSHGHPAPMGATELIGPPPRARAVMASLGEGEGVVGKDEPTWVQLARDEGALVFADVGCDAHRGALRPRRPRAARRRHQRRERRHGDRLLDRGGGRGAGAARQRPRPHRRR